MCSLGFSMSLIFKLIANGLVCCCLWGWWGKLQPFCSNYYCGGILGCAVSAQKLPGLGCLWVRYQTHLGRHRSAGCQISQSEGTFSNAFSDLLLITGHTGFTNKFYIKPTTSARSPLAPMDRLHLWQGFKHVWATAWWLTGLSSERVSNIFHFKQL